MFTPDQLDAFHTTLAGNYVVSDALFELFRRLPKGTQPMHVMRTAISALAAFDDNADAVDSENVHRIGLQLLAQIPTVTCLVRRAGSGLTLHRADQTHWAS